MASLISMLIGAIAYALSNYVGRILVALGISYVTYSGVDLLLGSIKSQTIALFSSVPPQMLVAIHLSRIGESINILFSAIAAKYALQGLTSGTITKQVIKP
jgi:hypothetical protein